MGENQMKKMKGETRDFCLASRGFSRDGSGGRTSLAGA